MSYSSEHIHIMNMRFSEDVTVAEFEQWLSQIERFFLKKQNFALVMQTDVGTEFPEEYRQLLAQHGFKVLGMQAEDQDCAGHTVWLAQKL